uniref:WGS project CAEQ00000000 data, annotated contig 1577 n=1 Tax=Trypanosoma congolense (strain IL3000) TaxID=1068625 RepID=F9W773_TRYCI|nr:unnamed protein product [Trypanosoma congolense IL3000]
MYSLMLSFFLSNCLTIFFFFSLLRHLFPFPCFFNPASLRPDEQETNYCTRLKRKSRQRGYWCRYIAVGSAMDTESFMQQSSGDADSQIPANLLTVSFTENTSEDVISPMGPRRPRVSIFTVSDAANKDASSRVHSLEGGSSAPSHTQSPDVSVSARGIVGEAKASSGPRRASLLAGASTCSFSQPSVKGTAESGDSKTQHAAPGKSHEKAGANRNTTSSPPGNSGGERHHRAEGSTKNSTGAGAAPRSGNGTSNRTTPSRGSRQEISTPRKDGVGTRNGSITPRQGTSHPRPSSRSGAHNGPHAPASRRSSMASPLSKQSAESRTTTRRPSVAGRDSSRGRRGKKNTATVVKNEETSRTGIQNAQEGEFEMIMAEISVNGYPLQSKLIKKLESELKSQKGDLGKRLQCMESSAIKMIEQTAFLVDHVQRKGIEAMRESEILDEEVPLIHKYVPQGRVLPCVRGSVVDHQHENQQAARDPEDLEESMRIKKFFTDLRYSSSTTALKGLGPEGVIDSVEKMTGEMKTLATVFGDLLTRTQRMISQSRDIIKAQQAALDECATRVEVADDILREASERQRENLDHAFEVVQHFSVELRHRIDKIEQVVLGSLEQFISSVRDRYDVNRKKSRNNTPCNQESLEEIGENYITAMEMAAAEQGKLLCDVRRKLINLWKNRLNLCDKERATLTFSGLPKEYKKSLELCDYDMLCRLIHFVSLNSDEARELLIGALDEHESFLQSNSVEAEVASQRGILETAVRSLLKKLEEEGDIRGDMKQTKQTYEERVRDLVEHYSTYMARLDKRKRRELRRRAANEASYHLPFFDKNRPVPEEYAMDLDSRPGFVKPPAICRSITPVDQKAEEKKHDGTHSPSPQSATGWRRNNDGVSVFAGVRPPPCSRLTKDIDVNDIKRHLHSSCPSGEPMPGPTSVVGYGRWGGRMPYRSPSSGNLTGPTLLSTTENREPLDALRRKQSYRKVPPPMVPPRKALLDHLLQHHSRSVESRLRNPQDECHGVWGEDKPLVERQVELLKSNLM